MRLSVGPAPGSTPRTPSTRPATSTSTTAQSKRRYVELYFEKYVKLDPSTTQHYFAEIDEPISTKDFIDYDEFVQTRFYKEWARPQRLVDHVTSVLEKSSTSVALFGVFRNESQGLVDDEMRRRMRLVAPHVRRAVLISRLIDLKTAEAAAWADTLDGIRAGVILVDAAGRIVQSNGAGHALLTAGDRRSRARGPARRHRGRGGPGDSRTRLRLQPRAMPSLGIGGHRRAASLAERATVHCACACR